MIRLLDKNREIGLLGELFDLMHENMAQIALSELGYAEEKASWLDCVGAALEKAPRQIVLLYMEGKLAGFCMYYVNGGVFMIEELQLHRAYQRTGAIVRLHRFFREHLPKDVQFMEAYTAPRNTYAQLQMRKLGMQPVADETGEFLHFRGRADRVLGRGAGL